MWFMCMNCKIPLWRDHFVSASGCSSCKQFCDFVPVISSDIQGIEKCSNFEWRRNRFDIMSDVELDTFLEKQK